MKMTKRSRKLFLSAGMLAAVAAIPSPPLAEAACSVSLTCPDGRVITCSYPGTACRADPAGGYVICGRNVDFCDY